MFDFLKHLICYLRIFKPQNSRSILRSEKYSVMFFITIILMLGNYYADIMLTPLKE